MNKLFKTITDSRKNNRNRRHTDRIANHKDVVQLHPHQSIEHKITISELELLMYIGVLPEEKQKQQRVTVCVDISLAPTKSYEDNIENTVSYAEIIEDIKSLAQERHFELVETLADEITNLCLRRSQVIEAVAHVKKPDIIKEVQAVGCIISKKR
jgi:dihydroneopterin aldolase